MIVIPMAGLSSRFFKAGYKKPKYMLEAHGKTLFEHAVNSFNQYFSSEKFLFIVRDVYDTPAFVEQQIRSLGIKDFHISILDCDTRGQAETVAVGLKDIIYHGAITIFNIDTFRFNFQFPDLEKMEDGYLEVFEGVGDNWSFAKPMNENSSRVSLTAEKKPISNLCCTGLYHFADLNDFINSFDEYQSMPKEMWEKGELYVAPLYNLLINKGRKIHYNLIRRNEVVFCGVPDEYTEFKISEK